MDAQPFRAQHHDSGFARSDYSLLRRAHALLLEESRPKHRKNQSDMGESSRCELGRRHFVEDLPDYLWYHHLDTPVQ